jgi:hypothetical protein
MRIDAGGGTCVFTTLSGLLDASKTPPRRIAPTDMTPRGFT